MSDFDTDTLLQFVNVPRRDGPAEDELSDRFAAVSGALRKLEAAVTPEGVPRIEKLHDKLGDFVARVSLIGQVKAGKTALANGLLGTDGLLPSDVNPWTSVVTSLHVNVEHPKGKRAIFRFFDEDDWANMVDNGGRIADLARKAKFDTKLEELTTQIKDMKRRTEERLGRNFKMLLGNQHAFLEYNTDLIKRYVCLGEEDMLAQKEGRFADLTKTADIYMEHPGFAYPLTLADTPGVNDPFLIREAATLDNLGNTDICVVVLSAHQALSTVDIGLMRVLMSLKNQRIIVFVNRVDELEDTDKQIMEINAYVSEMLRKQKLPGDIPVVFGSALWAQAATQGSTADVPEDSLIALQNLIAARQKRLPHDAVDRANIDELSDVSGMTALRNAIDDIVSDHVLAPFMKGLAEQAFEVAERSSVYLRQTFQADLVTVDPDAAAAATRFIEQSQSRIPAAVARKQTALAEQLTFEIAEAYREFINAEKRSLKQHLESSNRLEDWAPDSGELRRQLNAAYGNFADEAENFFHRLGEGAAHSLAEKYRGLLGENGKKFDIPAPTFESPGTPISLMRTLTIDLSANFIAGWFKRRLQKDAYLEEFEQIALADMRSTLEEIKDDNLSAYCDAGNHRMYEFLYDHAETIKQLSQLGDSAQRAELQKKLGVESEVEGRLADIADAMDLLHAERDIAKPRPAANQ